MEKELIWLMVPEGLSSIPDPRMEVRHGGWQEPEAAWAHCIHTKDAKTEWKMGSGYKPSKSAEPRAPLPKGLQPSHTAGDKVIKHTGLQGRGGGTVLIQTTTARKCERRDPAPQSCPPMSTHMLTAPTVNAHIKKKTCPCPQPQTR